MSVAPLIPEPEAEPVAVSVHGDDPVLRAGVAAQLRGRTEVTGVAEPGQAAVVVLVADELDELARLVARRLHGDGARPIVLVLSRIDERALLAGAEVGVSGFVRRAEAVPDRLVPVIMAAARGEASIPPDLVGGLLSHASRTKLPTGDGSPGVPGRLTRREIDVLRLASEGMETAEIARQLSYSERTVKGVIHDVTTRFQLRNRTHAVAYAVRLGLI